MSWWLVATCFHLVACLVKFGVGENGEISQLAESIHLHVTTPEEQSVGRTLLRLPEAIALHDKETRTSSHSMQIHLLPEHDWMYFQITDHALLINSRRLDYETLCTTRERPISDRLSRYGGIRDASTCELTINAIVYENATSNSSPTRRLRHLTVTITLLDLNDNRPQCVRNYPLDSPGLKNTIALDMLDVPENTAPGTVIARWTLTDRDTKKNGISESRLFGTQNGQANLIASELPFRLQFDGVAGPWSKVELKLVLTQRLDYVTQSINGRRSSTPEMDWYDLKIILLDSRKAVESRSKSAVDMSNSLCRLRVRIVDINDHSPVWSSPLGLAKGEPIDLELIEGRAYGKRELLQLSATDADHGRNAKMSYHFLFDLKNYTLLSIPEQWKMVEDEHYAKLMHQLFILDQSRGTISLRGSALDFEAVRDLYPLSYGETTPGKIPLRLPILAMDQPTNRTNQRYSPVALITIWLIDINDNPPEIQIIGLQSTSGTMRSPHRSNYVETIRIAENLPPNEPVAFIIVTDPDMGNMAHVQCRVNDASLVFSNDYAKQQPTISTEINHSMFQLIRIHPEGSRSMTEPVDEVISPIGAKLARHYKLITLKSLDREEQDRYRLNISCTDGLTTSDSGGRHAISPSYQTSFRLIDIRVQDRNDNAPRIHRVFHVEPSPEPQQSADSDGVFHCFLEEHSQVGTRICQLRAIDADTSSVGDPPLEWWLADEINQKEVIQIEKATGWLVVANERSLNPTSGRRLDVVGLDRETLALVVFVRDGLDTDSVRLTSNASVLIHIVDINDHVPKITEFTYFQISEDVKPHAVIGRLLAMDADQANTSNSELMYSIASLGKQKELMSHHIKTTVNDGQYPSLQNLGLLDDGAENLKDITLDSQTGELRVGSQGLDRERHSSYKFLVSVTDGQAVNGHPSLAARQRHTAYTVVHIVVEDVNDNSPRIIYPEKQLATFTVACPSLQKLPHTVAQIAVNDSDSGPNAEVLYFITPLRAALKPGSRVNRETMKTNTTVGNSPRETIGIATTTTTEPTLIGDEKKKPKTEHNQAINHTQQNVFNDEPTVTMLPFQINPQTGLLSMIRAPEDGFCEAFEQKRESETAGKIPTVDYRIQVTVSDRGVPPLSSSVTLLIRIVPSSTHSMHPDRWSPRGIGDEVWTSNRSPHATHSEGGNTALRSHQSASGLQRDPFQSEPATDADSWGALSSPDIFWAATICLTVATGVLIFLILLIAMITCGRRNKSSAINCSETQCNEWVEDGQTDRQPPSHALNTLAGIRTHRSMGEYELNTAKGASTPSSRLQSPSSMFCAPPAYCHTGTLSDMKDLIKYNPHVHLATLESHTGSRSSYSPLLTSWIAETDSSSTRSKLPDGLMMTTAGCTPRGAPIVRSTYEQLTPNWQQQQQQQLQHEHNGFMMSSGMPYDHNSTEIDPSKTRDSAATVLPNLHNPQDHGRSSTESSSSPQLEQNPSSRTQQPIPYSLAPRKISGNTVISELLPTMGKSMGQNEEEDNKLHFPPQHPVQNESSFV